jgi:hypothetical protein
VERPDIPRGAWWLPAILWAVGSVVVIMVGFGAGTSCTNSRPEGECSAINEWASFGVLAAGLVAVLPMSRAVRQQARPWWFAAGIGGVFAIAVVGMSLV